MTAYSSAGGTITSISEPLLPAACREGYEVAVTAGRVTAPSTRALGEGVDLILLDLGLPELGRARGCAAGSGPGDTPCRC